MNWKLTNFCEIDKYASKAYCAIHGVDESLNLGDITLVNPDEIEDFNMICGGSPCFVAGTQIFTDKGYKCIEDIIPGDRVLSHDSEFHEVTHTGFTTNQEIWELKVDKNDVTYATGNHPYYIMQNGKMVKKPLCELSLDDKVWQILKVNDLFPWCEKKNLFGWTERKVISVTKTNQHTVVYNMTVADTHTYTANNILVGNCQDFSISGKKQGTMWTCKACGYTYNPLTVHYSKRDKCPHCESIELEMTRSSLLIEFLRMIRAKKPECGIYENVKNIVGKAFRESFDLFEKELQEYGYNTYWKVMNAKDYGVPQNRERLFLVFIRKDKDNGNFVFPEKIPLTLKLKDILETEVDEKYYMNQKKVKVLTDALKAREANELHQVAQIYPDSGNPQAGRIYDANGISPTMDTCSGGNRMPKVLVKQATKKGYDVAEVYDTINLEQPNSMTRRGRVGKQVAQTINTAPQQVVVMPIDKSVNNPREIDVANCITTREDRGISNRKAEGTAVVESVNKLDLTDGREPLNTDKDGNAYAIRSQYYKISAANLQSGKHSATGVIEMMEEKGSIIDDTQNFDGVRFYDDYAPALRASRSGLKTLTNYRIRKLTPTECFKLQGFEPNDVEAARSVGISNAQLYKQAGNSICVDCLYYIYKELYKAMPYLFDDIKVGSFFSGIGAPERALEKLEKNIDK